MFLTTLALSTILLFDSPTVVSRPLPRGKIRDTTVNYIVIHYDSGSINSTYRYLRKKHNSYHYYITKAGTIYKFIDPKYEANHAGTSMYRGYYGMNHYSIGICLENNGSDLYKEIQYSRLAWLINEVDQRFNNSPKYQIVGHDEIAYPYGRKQDPGEHFNWTTLINYTQHYDRY